MIGNLISREKVESIKMPSVPKQWRWIRKVKVDAYDICGVKTWAVKYQCDQCGFIHTAIEDHGIYDYCPKCGAKMDK